MKTRIAVVTHRPYRICDDELYLPVMAGSFSMPEPETNGYVRDDSGENISDKNAQYCELTGLYWIWKNSDADNIGLCHYRRYFARKRRLKYRSRREILSKTGGPFDCVLHKDEAICLLEQYPVILPRPRRYFIENNYSQFAHSHGSYALDVTRKIITERYPEYIDAYDRTMDKTTGHRFNMFIMRRELLDRYCSWLFDLLFELEKRIAEDKSDDNKNDDRLCGYVAERLLDVWLDKEGCDYLEIPYVFIGKEHLVRKAAAMVLRKIKANTWISTK